MKEIIKEKDYFDKLENLYANIFTIREQLSLIVSECFEKQPTENVEYIYNFEKGRILTNNTLDLLTYIEKDLKNYIYEAR